MAYDVCLLNIVLNLVLEVDIYCASLDLGTGLSCKALTDKQTYYQGVCKHFKQFSTSCLM